MKNTSRKHVSGGKPGRIAALAAGIVMLFGSAAPAAAQGFELVLGEERFYPGIVLIFEGAVRDRVSPTQAHLAEELTNVHIEARANWDENEANIPPGTPAGGFVAYMNIHAQVTNETTGKEAFVTLTPHINLIDSLHYARNMALPGEDSDPYTVVFTVMPPDGLTLATHRDWDNLHGRGFGLFRGRTFKYTGVNFFDIATAPPRASAFAVPDEETYIPE